MTREQCHKADLIDQVLAEVRQSLERTDGAELAGHVKDLRTCVWVYSKAGPRDEDVTLEIDAVDGGVS
jgi:hypothetical protein